MSKRRRAIAIKRAYAAPSDEDGYRILVDRLWPRGLSKDKARLDLWLKDIAPSPALRIWFGHAPVRFVEFTHRYLAELNSNVGAVAEIEKILGQTSVTLVYAAKDETHNHAIVLRAFLESRRK
jgi:uncharacterized protein YeaO (DUF488 family)